MFLYSKHNLPALIMMEKITELQANLLCKKKKKSILSVVINLVKTLKKKKIFSELIYLYRKYTVNILKIVIFLNLLTIFTF